MVEEENTYRNTSPRKKKKKKMNRTIWSRSNYDVNGY